MDISALNSPPYEYYNKSSLFLDDHHHSSAFRRVSPPMSMPSPPELLMDTSEDEEDSISYTTDKKKSVPHKSPSMEDEDDQSIVFQLDGHSTSTVVGGGLLWAIRQRVAMARSMKRKNNMSIKKRTLKPLKVYLPKPHWSNHQQDVVIEEQDWYSPEPQPQPQPQPTLLLPVTAPMTTTTTTTIPPSIEKKVYKRKAHANSGRPTRVKGPCQACQETSDGCMRKAFNWPFQTNSTYNDKGKSFVYLCNKCGLRYNKSGGCVCRHCRWVLCKEEKRKAMQLIEQMRLSRPDGKVDLDEDIENFACTPKYWNCGRPWKVGWILNSQHDLEEDDDHSF